MSYLINNQQKINDIVFANRNKSYGAYAIRSTYGNTIVKSLSFVILGFGTIMSVAFYMSNRNNTPEVAGQVVVNDSTITTIVDMEKPKELPQEQPKQQPKTNPPAAGALSTNFNDSASVDTKTVGVDLTAINTGSSTGTDPVGPPTNTYTGGENTLAITPTVNVDPVIFADSQPEFEGGLKALYQFVASNIKYPNEALEMSKEGTLYVKFVVDQTGKVGNLMLQNNLGYGLDEEALRVVAMIPKFKKPGILKGQPVKVYFQLPIKFKVR